MMQMRAGRKTACLEMICLICVFYNFESGRLASRGRRPVSMNPAGRPSCFDIYDCFRCSTTKRSHNKVNSVAVLCYS